MTAFDRVNASPQIFPGHLRIREHREHLMESDTVHLGYLEIAEDFVPVDAVCHIPVLIGVLSGAQLELLIDEHKHEVMIDSVLLNRPDEGELRQTDLPADQKIETGSCADAAAWPPGISPEAVELIRIENSQDVLLGLLEELRERTPPMLIGKHVMRKLSVQSRLLKYVECLYFLAFLFREQGYIQILCLQCSILSLS